MPPPTTTAPQVLQCAADFTQFNPFSGTCFGVFTSKLNWQDADSDCKKRSATLAVFETWESIKWFENLRHTNTSELFRAFNPLTALKIARQKLIKIEISLSLRRVQNRQKQSRKTMIKVPFPSRHVLLLCSIKKFHFLFLWVLKKQYNNTPST